MQNRRKEVGIAQGKLDDPRSDQNRHVAFKAGEVLILELIDCFNVFFVEVYCFGGFAAAHVFFQCPFHRANEAPASEGLHLVEPRHDPCSLSETGVSVLYLSPAGSWPAIKLAFRCATSEQHCRE